MKRKIVIILVLLTIPFLVGLRVFAQDPKQELNELETKIQELQDKISQAQEQKKTLTNQINYMNSQIELTTLKISQTLNRIRLLEAQIQELARKIDILNKSLNDVSALFISRVVATYKAGQISSLDLLLSSDQFANFYRRWKYFKVVQLNDRQMLLAMEQMRADYDQRKAEKQEKQQELENLKAQLDAQKESLAEQKKDKEYLLTVTKNNEKEFQRLLAQARAEYQAIQAVLAGQGDEAEVGEIKAGQQIATIIATASCNSNGSHLHFTVEQGGSAKNPFNYLKGGVGYENCSGYTCGNGGDVFNPSGSWDWPMDKPIRLTQGYGNTWAVNHQAWLPYDFHNGIDIYNPSLSVKAVQDGTLYRGSYTGIGGCNLRYVRVDHKDSDISTYYLHINYTKV